MAVTAGAVSLKRHSIMKHAERSEKAMIKCKHKEIMLPDDFDICLIFLSANKYDRYHVVLEALETNVNTGIIRLVLFFFFLKIKMLKFNVIIY